MQRVIICVIFLVFLQSSCSMVYSQFKPPNRTYENPSPDGKWREVFSKYYEEYIDSGTWSNSYDFELISTDNEIRYTLIHETRARFGYFPWILLWSEDNSRVYFAEGHHVDLAYHFSNLQMIDLATGTIKQLPVPSGEMSVSPSEEFVAQLQHENQVATLLLFNIASSEVTRHELISPGVWSFPTWSPDSSLLVFGMQDEERNQLLIVDTKTFSEKVCTHLGLLNLYPERWDNEGLIVSSWESTIPDYWTYTIQDCSLSPADPLTNATS